ncbi:MAG TPA: hypothetical protein VF157_09040 [Chloroflexota bacterium]
MVQAAVGAVQAAPPQPIPHPRTGPVDPGQQAVGLRPSSARPTDHPVNTGPPEFVSAAAPPAPQQITEVAVVTPLMTVVQIANGVAIFGTAGGRAVIP